MKNSSGSGISGGIFPDWRNAFNLQKFVEQFPRIDRIPPDLEELLVEFFQIGRIPLDLEKIWRNSPRLEESLRIWRNFRWNCTRLEKNPLDLDEFQEEFLQIEEFLQSGTISGEIVSD